MNGENERVRQLDLSLLYGIVNQMNSESKYHFHIYFCKKCNKDDWAMNGMVFRSIEKTHKEIKCAKCTNFLSKGKYISENEFVDLLIRWNDGNILQTFKEVLMYLGIKSDSHLAQEIFTIRVLTTIKEEFSKMGVKNTNTRRDLAELKIILGMKKEEEVVVGSKTGKSALWVDHSLDENFGPHSDDFLEEHWEDFLGGPDYD